MAKRKLPEIMEGIPAGPYSSFHQPPARYRAII
jgi:hypothetical protein